MVLQAAGKWYWTGLLRHRLSAQEGGMAAMVKARVEIEINRPIEEVFDLWADMRNDQAWHPMAQGKAEMVTPGPLGVGTVFKGTYKRMGEVTEKTVAYERPTKLSRQGSARNFRMESNFILEKVSGDRTRLVASGSVTPLGLMKLMTPLMALMMPKQLYKVMYQLKVTAEKTSRNT